VNVHELISKWQGTPGGAEKKNFPLFIGDLCEVLGVPPPNEPAAGGVLGAYEYEAPVPKGSFRSLDAGGAVDLYKRGCFIMEAKQSYLKPEQVGLDLGEDDRPRAPSGARYDKLMRDARNQAENYAKNLPASEPVAPFLIVCDIGRAFEIYHDSAGNGRGYTFFPDKQSYRIELADLASDENLKGPDCTPLEVLRAIWTEPKSIDPRFKSADVTRTVASRLASVSQYIEEGIRVRSDKLTPREKAEEIEEAALFLMRILFCMFAEDIGLLPKDKFKAFLKRAETNDKLFENQLADLWVKMGAPNIEPRFAHALEDDVKYFNGGLFSETARTYALGGFVIHDLYEAARQNWRKVEPAIFGTLLEQALSPEERAKLGAHYTPRPYVETLVRATIMDVLEPEWTAIEESGEEGLLGRAQAFHERLSTIRVLDPACGTGNFLYVSMELMQALEARVIETIQTLGGDAEPKVGPHQFYGLEKNPRAAKIAELVLWIGWLRNRLQDDPGSVPQPVLAESANINFGRHGGYDAVLKMNESGQPDLANPTIPNWPESEFIVGNPPFIAGQDLREELGDDYAEALWKANPRVAGSADFVMQWWDRAAHQLLAENTPLLRFGFVTTNSITQEFSRRVIANYLHPSPSGEGQGVGEPSSAVTPEPPTPPAGRPSPEGEGLSLIMATPDHPWIKKPKEEASRAKGSKKNGRARGPAAVRIAMTVAEGGEHEGELREVKAELALDSDEPKIEFHEPVRGIINADLTIGPDATSTSRLMSNVGICHDGVKLHGGGFAVSRSQLESLGWATRDCIEKIIRPYRNGRDLTGLPFDGARDKFVIDLFGLEEKEVRTRFPEIYEHLLKTVKPERDRNRRESYRTLWWTFGEPRREMRPALESLQRYIATVDTAKHRVFQFLDEEILCDDKVVVIADDQAHVLGVLQSDIHVEWSLRVGGWMGVGNDSVYVKSKTFDPFPFPDATPEQRVSIAELAEELDVTRKAAIAETDKLTMTELYNLREKLRSGVPMDEKEQRRATKARAAIVNRLHEQLDEAVADAYGWGEEWRAGLLGPSEIVARLVALNHERAAEEKAGKIRWLRPEYQKPRFGKKEKAVTK
jgi:hypothetical protein